MVESGEPVRLNVYDLSQGMAKQMSMSLLGKVIEGIWHTGVVVYGREYWFGGGIQSSPSHSSPYGRPVQTISMGDTQVPKELFDEFLSDISSRYTVETYSLLTHNCNNFSDEVCQFLTGQAVPSHIVQLPTEVLNSPLGALILPMVERLETTLRYGGVPQPPHPVTGAGNFPDFSSVPVPPAATTSSGTRSASTAGAATSAVSLDKPAMPSPSPPVGSRSARDLAAAAAEARAVAADVPPAVVPAKAPGVKGSPQGEVSGRGEGGEPGGAAAAATGESSLRETKAKVHEEITKEFSLIMAAGGLKASEAAAEAMRRVMQRHGLAGANAGTPSNTAGA